MSHPNLGILEWERPPGGTKAVLHDHAVKIRHPGSALKNLAAAKMTGVSVISAHFGEEHLVYDPWVSVLLDSGNGLIFHGAYGLSFPLEEHQNGLPHVCLRTCSWDRELDFSQFDQASNKRDYLLGDKQLRSDIMFGSGSRYLSFKTLVSRLCAAIGQGLKGQETERPDAVLCGIAVESATDYFSWKFSYSPHSFVAEKLEEWIEAWREAFKHSTSDFVPTGDTEISYQPSVMERLENA